MSIQEGLFHRKPEGGARRHKDRVIAWLLGGLLVVPVVGALPAGPAEASETELRPAHEQRRRVHRHTRSSHRTYVRRHTVRHYHYPSYSWGYYYHPPVVYAPPPVIVVAPEPVYVSAEPIYVEAEPVYVEEEPVYVAAEPVYVEEAPEAEVYAEPEPAEEAFGASFVVRFLGQNQSDADLSVETIKGAQLWGLGGALRFDLDPHWMFELGADFLGADVDGASQLSIPVSLSAIAHLFPDSIIDPYGIAGLGIIFTQYDDPSFTTAEQYTQFEAHVGFGAEVNLGDWLLTADLRFLFMQARPERDGLVPVDDGQPAVTEPTANNEEPANSVSVRGSGLGVATGAQTLEGGGTGDPDELQTGLQFMVGAGWRF